MLSAIAYCEQPRLVALHGDDVRERFEVGAKALRDLACGVELEHVSPWRLRSRVVVFLGVVGLGLGGLGIRCGATAEGPQPNHRQTSIGLERTRIAVVKNGRERFAGDGSPHVL